MPFSWSDEVIEAVRHRYENELSVPVASIADEVGMNEKTVYRLASHFGWRKRSAPRELPQHVRLAEAAREAANPSSWPGRAEGASPGHPRLEQGAEKDVDASSVLDRLERLVRKELAIEEAERATLGNAPRRPADAAHKARAYATLLQIVQGIERTRRGEPLPAEIRHNPDDDVPEDLDEFRFQLARRIEAFVASRTAQENGDANGEPEVVCPDE